MLYQVIDYGEDNMAFYIRSENSIDKILEVCTNHTLFGILAEHTRFVNADDGLVYGIPTNMALWAYLRKLYKDRTVV